MNPAVLRIFMYSSTAKWGRASAAMLLLVAAVVGELPAATPGPPKKSSWGDILIGGGVCEQYDSPLAAAELYDPAANRFVNSRMKSVRSGATAALIRSGPNAGKILITGGDGGDYEELASAELYDPATSTVAPGPSMHTGRVWHTATTIALGPLAGQILVAGGQGRDRDGLTIALRSTELYDPVSNSFKLGPTLHVGRYSHIATPIISGTNIGEILVAGGTEANWHRPLSSSELYDPTGGIMVGPTMNVARTGHTATNIIFGKNAGKILLAGGDDSRNGGINVSPLSSTEMYDPVSNRFLRGPTMKTARDHHSATVIESGPNRGRILIAGGSSLECKGDNCHGDELSSTELYDPVSDAFTPGPSMNYWRSYHTASVIESGPNAGEILITGGIDFDPSAPSELYDPLANKFMSDGRATRKHGGCHDMFAIQLSPSPASGRSLSRTKRSDLGSIPTAGGLH
jgi:hypothetical protein